MEPRTVPKYESELPDERDADKMGRWFGTWGKTMPKGSKIIIEVPFTRKYLALDEVMACADLTEVSNTALVHHFNPDDEIDLED